MLFPLLLVVRRLLTTRQGGLDPQRDTLEKDLIASALQRQLPMLGICRGMQLINVVAGGNLHQALDGFYEEHPQIRSVLPRKPITARAGSRLSEILGDSPCRVNALHRQAIDRLGEGLRIAACEASGVVQAFEGRGRAWLIGVQWHPEYLPQRPDQQALFGSLVEAARRYTGRS